MTFDMDISPEDTDTFTKGINTVLKHCKGDSAVIDRERAIKTLTFSKKIYRDDNE